VSRLPHDWLLALMSLLQREPTVVRVVIAEARGSVPREPGAFMLVSRGGVEGTVGGGRLEWECIAAARELLDDTQASARLSKVVLAADVGQCCGGVVFVWLDRFTRADLGLLALARDAGGRGAAVLSSTVAGPRVERRLICRDRARPGSTAGDGEVALSDVAVGAAAAGGAAMGDVAAGQVAAGADAGSTIGAGADSAALAADVDALAEALLGAPRVRARPRAVRGRLGELTFLERLDDARPALWLYGAGHVGQALARIVAELPVRLTWVDSRAELFPAALGGDVRLRSDADPVATVSEVPAGGYFLVMTHSHPLDYELCRAILRRNDFTWLGLIGSESKAARFRSRLAREGVGADRIARLVSPIGVPGIQSKWPAAIAVGVVAQLLQEMSAAALDAGLVDRAQQVGQRLRVEGSGGSAGSAGSVARVVRALSPVDVRRGRETGLPGVASLDDSTLPPAGEPPLPGVPPLPTVLPPSPGDCGQESCSTCGARRRPLG
jgi:xanthine dehydrogenase accessory factor